MRKCPQCYSEYNDDIYTCSKCNSTLERYITYCPKCGTIYKSGVGMCNDCHDILRTSKASEYYSFKKKYTVKKNIARIVFFLVPIIIVLSSVGNISHDGFSFETVWPIIFSAGLFLWGLFQDF